MLIMWVPLSSQDLWARFDSIGDAYRKIIMETTFLVDNGKYQEALTIYLDFFDVSFDQKPTPEIQLKKMYLDKWGRELSAKYNTALMAFMEYRDEKILEFRNGIGYDWAFEWLLEMNKILDQEEQSIWLFEELRNKNKVRGMFLFRYIKPVAIRQQRYDLLAEYGYDPETEFQMATFLYQMPDLPPEKKDSLGLNTAKKDLFVDKILEIMHLGLILEDTSGVLLIREKARAMVTDSLFYLPLDSLPEIRSY
jgi:hypothetical protein